MAYWLDGGPEHDLYTYSGGSGFPSGWNTDHHLYQYRDILQHCGVSPRLLINDTNPLHVWPGGIPGGLSGTRDAINYVNPRYPRMGVRVSQDLFIFVMHFWFGSQVYRTRPSSNDLWVDPLCRSLRADGTLRSYANADFLGPYNRLAGPVIIATQDCGLTEWTVGSPDNPGGYPQIVRTQTIPHAGPNCWLLENQGRAIPLTLNGLAIQGTIGPNTVYNFIGPSGMQLYGGDSGAPIFVEMNDTLYLWGHVLTATVQPPFCIYEFPNLSAISSYAEPMTTVAPAVEWAIATQTSLDELKAAIQAIYDGVAGI